MPHVIVKLYPGRSDAVKTQLADTIAKDVAEIADCRESTVSVAFEEIEKKDWAETVYKPEIIDKLETVYKKPGYNPFKTKPVENQNNDHLRDQVRGAAELAQNSDTSTDFNAMTWLEEQLENNPESFDRFFDIPWNELSDDQRHKRAMDIRRVL